MPSFIPVRNMSLPHRFRGGRHRGQRSEQHVRHSGRGVDVHLGLQDRPGGGAVGESPGSADGEARQAPQRSVAASTPRRSPHSEGGTTRFVNPVRLSSPASPRAVPAGSRSFTIASTVASKCSRSSRSGWLDRSTSKTQWWRP